MKLNKQQMDQAIEILKKTIPGAKTEKRKDMVAAKNISKKYKIIVIKNVNITF